MLKIAGTVLCELAVYTVLRQYRSEYAIFSQLVSSAVLVFLIGDGIRDALDAFSLFSKLGSVPAQYVSVLIKVLGISVVTQLTSDTCRDSGNSAAATRLEFSGKVLIVTAALPVIKDFTSFISQMIETV